MIVQLRDGSQRAFEAIYERYFHRLYAFSVSFTKSHEDTEEIVEDVFVRLWQARATLHEEQGLHALLFTMSRRLLINAYRARINSPVFEDYVEFKANQGYEQADLLAYDDFVKRLNREINRLPATQGSVIRLAKFDGLKNKEIAGRLGLSEQTVKNQLSLAVKALRERMKDVAPWLLMLFLLK